MTDGYMLEKVLNKINELIGVENLDETKLLLDMEDKLLDDNTLKNVVISTTILRRSIVP